LKYTSCVYSKIVHVLAFNKKSKRNKNGVPENKGQFEAVIDSNVSRNMLWHLFIIIILSAHMKTAFKKVKYLKNEKHTP